MALNVISNFAANVAHRNLTNSDREMTSSLAKLSSGTRVVSAKDDAASMAIGSRLSAEVKSLTQAKVNSGQAVSMLQVGDGAMARVHDILIRMKTLSVQAGSGNLSATERGMLDTEYQQLLSEVDRIALDTEFNGVQLVNGSINVDRTAAAAFDVSSGLQDIVLRGVHANVTQASIAYEPTNQTFTVSTLDGTNPQVDFSGSIAPDTNDGSAMNTGTVVILSSAGLTEKVDLVLNTAWDVDAAHATGTLGITGSSTTTFEYKVGTGTTVAADTISVTLNSISAQQLAIATTNITTQPQADAALAVAIDTLNDARASVGASQNRLEFAAANIATTMENMEAARSNLLDLDVAAEMSTFTSKQILVQAGVAMMAQANQSPQNLLRLFQ